MTGPRAFDPAAIREITQSKRFLAADRAALDLGELATWDPYLLREHRLLVPIDVQALYVPKGSTEKMVRLPMLVAGPNGVGVADPEDGMPDPFTAGTPRPPGVHLHWAVPDALSAMFAALPGTPMNSDQWKLLKRGNVASGALPGCTQLGVQPRPLGLFLDRWMTRYRKHGRFGDKRELA